MKAVESITMSINLKRMGRLSYLVKRKNVREKEAGKQMILEGSRTKVGSFNTQTNMKD